MNIRSFIFWFLDFLKGNPVLKNLKEIIKINEKSDLVSIAHYQKEKLEILLQYANENISFYRNKGYATLQDFPVLSKLEYKSTLDSFCSPKFDRATLYKAITSGSTGTPFVSYQNKEKKQRNTADVLYFGSLAGYNFGETLYYLKIWSTNNKKSRETQLKQNIIPVDVLELSGKRVEIFMHMLNNGPKNIHINSYASALEEVCKYLDKMDVNSLRKDVNVKSIIAQSEGLNMDTKIKSQKYFKCLPCSRYSNLENGVLAQETQKFNTVFKVNSASYIFEILKMEEDMVADPNELGRIVITDLFNYAMPFIRYDTGDIGKYSVKENGEIDFTTLTEIQGRKLDLLLNTKGDVLSSYIMYKNMYQYPEIDQYQLIQEDKCQYRFVISIKGNFEREHKLKNEFVSILGKDAEFIIDYVDEIPLLSSGKRRKIINNYLKNRNSV